MQRRLSQDRVKYFTAAARKITPSYAYNGLRRAFTKDIPKFTEKKMFTIENELREGTKTFCAPAGILF